MKEDRYHVGMSISYGEFLEQEIEFFDDFLCLESCSALYNSILDKLALIDLVVPKTKLDYYKKMKSLAKNIRDGNFDIEFFIEKSDVRIKNANIDYKSLYFYDLIDGDAEKQASLLKKKVFLEAIEKIEKEIGIIRPKKEEEVVEEPKKEEKPIKKGAKKEEVKEYF